MVQLLQIGPANGNVSAGRMLHCQRDNMLPLFLNYAHKIQCNEVAEIKLFCKIQSVTYDFDKCVKSDVHR